MVGSPLLHPLIFSIYPILLLYGANLEEVRLGQVVLPMAISAGAAALLYLVLTRGLKSGEKAGLIVSLPP